MPWGGMMGYGWGGGLGMGIGWLLSTVVFWGAIIAAVVFGVRWLSHQGAFPGGGARVDSALETLKQRYARGEIDREEFQTKKRDLLA